MNSLHFHEKMGVIHFGGDTSFEAAAELFAALCAMGTRPVRIVFNSYGGSVDGAFACHDAIRMYPGVITGVVCGTAQSAALLPFLACDVRLVTTESTLMIHEGSNRLGTLHPREFKSQAEHMEKLDARYMCLVAKYTRLPLQYVQEISTFATYLSAEQAVTLGFAKRVLSEPATRLGKQTAVRKVRAAKLNAAGKKARSTKE